MIFTAPGWKFAIALRRSGWGVFPLWCVSFPRFVRFTFPQSPSSVCVSGLQTQVSLPQRHFCLVTLKKCSDFPLSKRNESTKTSVRIFCRFRVLLIGIFPPCFTGVKKWRETARAWRESVRKSSARTRRRAALLRR